MEEEEKQEIFHEIICTWNENIIKHSKFLEKGQDNNLKLDSMFPNSKRMQLYISRLHCDF